MKLQARFLLLFMALFAIIAALVGGQQWFEGGRLHTLLENELAERKAYFAQIRSLDGQTLLSLSVDYSFWDEMVDFVDSGIRNLPVTPLTLACRTMARPQPGCIVRTGHWHITRLSQVRPTSVRWICREFLCPITQLSFCSLF
ncbi:hypothetical protein IPG36_07530 [bacterium]|nr:MAG: hypothetical protein IPG36_07530 [bacterium]